jgi:hypothetical protein
MGSVASSSSFSWARSFSQSSFSFCIVVVDEVTIGCNTELHVLVALVGKLLII